MNAANTFFRSAALYGDRAYMNFRDRPVSFPEFEALVRKAATILSDQRVKPRDHIAILASNKPEWLACYYAILARGAVVVPINPALKPYEIAHIVNDSTPKVVFVDAQLAERLAAVDRPPRILTLPADEGPPSDWERFDGFIEEMITPLDVDDEHPSIIYYTSGTMGRPKGAIMPHRSTLATIESTAEWLRLRPIDTTVITGSFAFILHSTFAAASHTNAGGTLVVQERFRPQDALAAIEKYKATVITWVPTMYVMTCEYGETEKIDLSSLRVCISGGAPLPWALAERFYNLCGRRILSGWGMSEGTPITGFDPDETGRPESIGRPLLYCTVKIVDEQQQREVSPREVGELVYLSPKNMTAYLNRPIETAATLRDGWIYSGDLGWRDEEGYLYISGRKKEMIIRGGAKIYPAEVEDAVLKSEEVAEAAVLGVPDQRFGERIVAVVTARAGKKPSAESLRSHCETFLAAYKIPQQFIVVADLPRGPTGKILKRVLREELEGRTAAELVGNTKASSA
jgi:long-chain acyl-CoA synthetase